ncbi:MAG: geranylgeranyl reductase family protein [Acidimicrobiales bacterium]
MNPSADHRTVDDPLSASNAPLEPDAVGHRYDVLVVGGGPAGSSCAYWLAEAGWDVALCEKKVFPREKTCGDGLTPRAVRQIADMGVEGSLTGAHRYDGLRANAYGKSLELSWPDHPTFPSYGYVITRHDLDGIVNDRAAKAGATIWQGTEAVAPLIEEGSTPHDARGGLRACRGALVRDKATGETRQITARYVVVADGSNSRFGRALGTTRDRNQPMGMALRTYYRSPGHDRPFIESFLDLRDGSGQVVPGYGWIFPLGDGRVNAGVGLLSTDRRWKGVNTTSLMERFVAWAPREWELTPQNCLGPATGGKLPMGLAIGPIVGSTTLVVGDAAGTINPFNGEGIAYGYESGRLAAASLGEALSGDGPEALAGYERRLDETWGLYYRVARAFIRMISNPELMALCVGSGMYSGSLMGWLLKIMANLLRPDETGPAEAAYRALALVARMTPEGP